MTRTLLAVWAAFTVARTQGPDSAARARLADALATLRDSLDAVRGAAAAFRADLSAASSTLLRQRTQRLRATCSGAARAAAQLDAAMSSPPAGASSPARRPAQTKLRRELAALRGVLAECERDYDTTRWATRADSVRAWAPFRLRRLDEAARRYTEAAAAFTEPRHPG